MYPCITALLSALHELMTPSFVWEEKNLQVYIKKLELDKYDLKQHSRFLASSFSSEAACHLFSVLLLASGTGSYFSLPHSQTKSTFFVFVYLTSYLAIRGILYTQDQWNVCTFRKRLQNSYNKSQIVTKVAVKKKAARFLCRLNLCWC